MRSLITLALGTTLLMGTAASAADLRIGLQEDPDVLDPHRARTFVGRIVFTSLCDKLIDITPELGFQPQLATAWSWSDDGKALTFELRDDATFHDGAKIDAEAVKANIERAKSLPDSLRRSELTSVESVEVVSPTEVTLRLSKPDATVLAQLSDRAGMMLAPSAFEGFGQKPVCSGPYRFVERVQNDRIVLEKYPQHRDAAQYHFDRLTFLPIPDTTVRLANLQAGDLDILERLAATDVAAASADSSLEVVSTVGIGYQGMTLNLANGARGDTPLGKDKRVRQALSLSIDREVINQVVFEGAYPPTVQPFPLASPYYDKALPPPPRDVEKARALLKEAGHETVPLEIQFGNNNVQRQVNEIIQAMAAEAGFQISLRPTEFAAMQKEMQAGNFQITQIGWSGRVDPDGNIHQFVSCNGALNDSKYCNEEVDRLLNGARATTDEAERRRMYGQAQAILQDELPMIYLYYQPWQYAMTAKLEGFRAFPDGMIRLAGVELAEQAAAMGRFLAHRVAVAIPTLLIVTILVFALQKILPGDPVLTMAGEERDPQVLEYLREKYRLNDPLPLQYLAWLGSVATGDLGISLRTDQPVTVLILDKLPVTIELAVLAMLVAILVGIPAGIVSAVRKGTLTDYAANVVALSGLSIPNFWLGIMLILLVSVRWQLLPASGYVPPGEDLAQNLRTMIMPAFVLGTGLAGSLMRHTRAAMLGVLRQDYIRTARAKGLLPRSVIWKHALRNALIPIVTIATLLFGELLAGAVLTEQVFTIPGFGKLIVDAVFNRDYAVVQGVVLCVAVGFIAMNLLADMLYFLINPRMRRSA